MTLIIAFKCLEGIVVVADTELLIPIGTNFKLWKIKIKQKFLHQLHTHNHIEYSIMIII